VNFAAAPGTLTTITGPFGAGKSILAGLVGGTICPSKGTVTFAGHDVHAEFSRLRRRIKHVAAGPGARTAAQRRSRPRAMPNGYSKQAFWSKPDDRRHRDVENTLRRALGMGGLSWESGKSRVCQASVLR
jgi:ABC-type Mn2+/Zn2+ transport system ATPase subunit